MTFFCFSLLTGTSHGRGRQPEQRGMSEWVTPESRVLAGCHKPNSNPNRPSIVLLPEHPFPFFADKSSKIPNFSPFKSPQSVTLIPGKVNVHHFSFINSLYLSFLWWWWLYSDSLLLLSNEELSMLLDQKISCFLCFWAFASIHPFCFVLMTFAGKRGVAFPRRAQVSQI